MIVRRLGLCHYAPVWEAMRDYTVMRESDAADQLWLVQHHPVYTRGTGCRDAPRTPAGDAADIPTIHSDRGGQITYHGPGQLIAYLLLDLRRRKQGVKSLVWQIEQAVIDLLDGYRLTAARRPGAPGVYIGDAKIAALGLRIKRGCAYHGLSLNVDLDLRPYSRIDPCGYAELAVTRLSAHVSPLDFGEVEARLVGRLSARFDG